MSFTVKDYQDFAQLLAQHPEWRAELRRLLLLDDLLALPEMVKDLLKSVRELTAAQQRTEKRVDELYGIVRDLAAAQQRTEKRVDELYGIVRDLAAAQQRTEKRVDELYGIVRDLAEAQQRTEKSVRELVVAQQRTEKRLDELVNTVSGLKGQQMEITFARKAPAYFGRLLRGTQIVPSEKLTGMLGEQLSDQEFHEVLLTDLVLRGQPSRRPDLDEVWVAVEVSAVVDRNDVDRARRRAALLRQAGYPAIPAVAGEGLTEGARAEAHDGSVVVLQDGRVLFWDEALAALGTP